MAQRHPEVEQQIRIAAENLLGSSSSNQLLPSNDGSLNTVLSEVIPHGDIVTGMRPNGRMSVVRRFFCLFVTFDLLFTVLMWLICIMLISGDVFKMMSEQVVHYNIHTSLFDIVMAAVARFTVLLLFYGLLYINHWIIIAISTAGTCSFLLTKVFLYNWVSANSPVLQVLMIITSFVISWGEAWFLDFRVIPHEILAKDLVRGYFADRSANERSPLLQPYLQGLPERHEELESIPNFYSPMDSLAGSDDDDEHQGKSEKELLVLELIKTARNILSTAMGTISLDDWRLEKQLSNGDIVESRPRPTGTGRVYRLQGLVKVTPNRLLHVLYTELDKFPTWNPTLAIAERVEILDGQTDISYQVMAESKGGLVSARDFLTLRRWERQGTTFMLASGSTTHSAVPAKTKPIRAYQGPSCWILEQGEQKDQTNLKWLLDTELRGWIPQSLLDQAFAFSMIQWLNYLRKYTSSLPTATSVGGCVSRENFSSKGIRTSRSSFKPCSKEG